MDITPHVNLLRSLRGERTNYLALIGEGVDNAFDADATIVKVTIDKEEIAFEDNGRGITRDRIASMFSLGEHGAMSTTKLGRFGVGIKSQAVNAGNVFWVNSTSDDGEFTVDVDWRNVLKSGEWIIADPILLPATDPTGTTVVISALTDEPRLSMEKAAAELAQRFHPAIANEGKAIILNSLPVEALPEPAMTDIVERQLSLGGGRSAHLRAGILAAPSMLTKVHVAYMHRVILVGTGFGCGQYSGLNKLFARLQISGPWHLGKYKDDLPNRKERDELEEATLEALRPILEKCNASSMNAKLDRISNLVNEGLPEYLKPARPRHRAAKNATGNGGREGKKRRGRVDPDKSDEGGPAEAKRPPRDLLQITFDGELEKDGIGSYEKGSRNRPHTVSLSREEPTVAALLEHRDEQIGARLLRAFGLFIYEEGRARMRDPEFEFEGNFGKRVAKLLGLPGNTKIEEP